MFQHILVPLDGSPLAEKALPIAACIARKARSKITLLESVPPIVETSPYYKDVGAFSDNIYYEMVKEAKEYLERIAHEELLAGITVSTQTSSETPIQGILGYIQLLQVDLVVLYSHGYTGLKHWALGSVAQKIARHSSVPTLILREKSDESALVHPDKAHPMRAIVTLDGSAFAEAALLPAAQLVAAINGPQPAIPGELRLVRIVQPPRPEEEIKYQTYDFDVRAYQKNDAKSYLQATKEKFASTLAPLNLQITCSVIEDPEIADTLLNVAETGEDGKGYDLIAMATHGRGVLQRWIMGSTAERVIEETTLPILIVRPPEPAAQ